MKLRSIVFLLLFIILVGCRGNKSQELPNIQTFDFLATSEPWALVIDAYVAYYKTPTTESEIVAHGRKNDIIKTNGNYIDNEQNLWYKFENGWLLKKHIRLFKNKLQAQQAVNSNLS